MASVVVAVEAVHDALEFVMELKEEMQNHSMSSLNVTNPKCITISPYSFIAMLNEWTPCSNNLLC